MLERAAPRILPGGKRRGRVRAGFARGAELLGVPGDRDVEKTFSQYVVKGRPPKDDPTASAHAWICIYVCVCSHPFPRAWRNGWVGAVAGRSRRAPPEGREGRGRPCAARTGVGGWVGAAPQPRCSLGPPGACEAPAAPGYLPRRGFMSRAEQNPKPSTVRGGVVCLRRGCPGLAPPVCPVSSVCRTPSEQILSLLRSCLRCPESPGAGSLREHLTGCES